MWRHLNLFNDSGGIIPLMSTLTDWPLTADEVDRCVFTVWQIPIFCVNDLVHFVSYEVGLHCRPLQLAYLSSDSWLTADSRRWSWRQQKGDTALIALEANEVAANVTAVHICCPRKPQTWPQGRSLLLLLSQLELHLSRFQYNGRRGTEWRVSSTPRDGHWGTASNYREAPAYLNRYNSFDGFELKLHNTEEDLLEMFLWHGSSW